MSSTADLILELLLTVKAFIASTSFVTTVKKKTKNKNRKKPNTYFYNNNIEFSLFFPRHQEKRSVFVALWILIFLSGNIVYTYYTFSQEELQNR